MIFVILGMHKSGTTLVSQMLHQSGINMGEFATDLSYDNGNTYERRATQALNREILHGLLIPPLNYLLKRPFRSAYDPAGYPQNRDSVALVRHRALRRRLIHREPSKMQALINQYENTYTDWGFKDPRTCLTYPAWQQQLPPHQVIVVYRHYDELLRRYQVSERNLPLLFRVLHGWTLYNMAVLKIIKDTAVPAITLSYEKLMQEDEELRRLSAFVGRTLVDTRDHTLYRNRTHCPDDLPSAIQWLLPLLPADPREIYQQLDDQRDSECQSIPRC
ncbi:MAG: sulfotransferase [Ardenticatenaceae bacterium]|nr:sulfotransferase [Ardenticatenaceae bacterium]MCB9443908.1 sulfotransferase [Ardenticatenaceae bacterium]